MTVHIHLDENSKVIANSLLSSAVAHILKNCVIHNTKDDKQVYISTIHDSESNTITLEIEDNGPGIDMSVKKIIESGVETPLQHTTGLGLWIVKWIIELVDGKLSISNRKGSDGTKVRIVLHEESANIDEVRNKNILVQSDFNLISDISDTDSDIKTTTRGS